MTGLSNGNVSDHSARRSDMALNVGSKIPYSKLQPSDWRWRYISENGLLANLCVGSSSGLMSIVVMTLFYRCLLDGCNVEFDCVNVKGSLVNYYDDIRPCYIGLVQEHNDRISQLV